MMEILNEDYHYEFKKELTSLLNKYNMDSMTYIPDSILADHLTHILTQLPYLMTARDGWFGFKSHLTSSKEKIELNEGAI